MLVPLPPNAVPYAVPALGVALLEGPFLLIPALQAERSHPITTQPITTQPLLPDLIVLLLLIKKVSTPLTF